MRAALIPVIVFILYQKITAKGTSENLNIIQYEIANIKSEFKNHNILDIWNSIKNTAKHVWENIQNLTDNAKRKIKDWIAKIKIKAQDLDKKFREQLNNMKDVVNEMINRVMETGEIAKKCLQERKQEINKILKTILLDVSGCISNSLSDSHKLSALQYSPISNQTEFLKNIQSEVNVCFKTYKQKDEVEKCIQNIRKGLYKNLEITEEYILKNNTEMRGATEDLLNTIVECTTDGIIKSTNVIANETATVIQCVSKG